MKPMQDQGEFPPRWGRCWFIYYRVRALDAARAAAAVGVAHGALRTSWPGVGAEILCRPSSDPDYTTLLEAFSAPAGWSKSEARAFEEFLENASQSVAGEWQHGPRRLEAFTPCV